MGPAQARKHRRALRRHQIDRAAQGASARSVCQCKCDCFVVGRIQVPESVKSVQREPEPRTGAVESLAAGTVATTRRVAAAATT